MAKPNLLCQPIGEHRRVGLAWRWTRNYTIVRLLLYKFLFNVFGGTKMHLKPLILKIIYLRERSDFPLKNCLILKVWFNNWGHWELGKIGNYGLWKFWIVDIGNHWSFQLWIFWMCKLWNVDIRNFRNWKLWKLWIVEIYIKEKNLSK